MNNYRKISFDIDFAGKKVLNTIQMPLEELTQNDFNSSLLTLKLMQGQELINLQGLSVVLNFLMPSGKDYVDTINAEMIDIENSIVSYSIPKDILSEVGMVVGTVSLYKEGYRYTSIVQFKFEVVSDFVEDGEIVESDNYPILAQMIGEVQNLKDEEMKRVESEIERIENEEERESSELQREMNEVERHEAENVRIINEQNREVKELERDQAERLREANSAKVKREEETRLEAETLRVQAESLRVGAESDRIQAESIRQMQESDRHEKELERQAAENLRVLAEIEREQKQNEFNARAEEVAVRIEEESQRISDLVEIEESKLVKPNDMVDYMGNQHNSLKAKSDSDVDYAVKTAIGEFNYLDYEGQHITATNSIEGHARSAILKGNTLVNILNGEVRGSINQRFFDYLIDIPFKDNQVYTAIFNVSTEATQLTCGLLKKTDEIGGIDWNGQTLPYVNGYNKVLLTPVSNSTYGLRIRYFDDIVATFEPSNVMLIEGDYTNVDIPYFEGMQSVRMPVLTTIGKNLLPLGNSQDLSTRGLIVTQKDGKLLINGVTTGTTDYRVFNVNNNVEQMKKFNSLPVGTTITLSNNLGKECYFNVIRNGSSIYLKNTITIEDGDKDINAFIRFNTNETHDNTELYVQIEYGAVATSYEPYKTNILSTPSDLVLGSVGNICDTLDIINKNVKQITHEFVIDGSQNIVYSENLGNTSRYYISLPYRGKGDSNVICDKIQSIANYSLDTEHLYVSTNDVVIFISNDKVQMDVSQLKAYFSENPITVRYILEQEVNKTVDLSDNVVYSYNGTTHYSCSSEEGSLVPTLSVKVPTDVQEVISEQRKIISEQEEAQNILIDSQLSLYESISGVQTLQTDGEEVQMPQYIIDLYELAYKRGIRKKGER